MMLRALVAAAATLAAIVPQSSSCCWRSAPNRSRHVREFAVDLVELVLDLGAVVLVSVVYREQML